MTFFLSFWGWKKSEIFSNTLVLGIQKLPRQPSPLSAKIPKARVDTRKVIENFMMIMALNSHLMTVHMGGESGLFAFFDLHFSVCFLNSLGYFAFSFFVDRFGGTRDKGMNLLEMMNKLRVLLIWWKEMPSSFLLLRIIDFFCEVMWLREEQTMI